MTLQGKKVNLRNPILSLEYKKKRPFGSILWKNGRVYGYGYFVGILLLLKNLLEGSKHFLFIKISLFLRRKYEVET